MEAVIALLNTLRSIHRQSLSGNWRYCDNCAQTIDNFFSDTHVLKSIIRMNVVHPNEPKRDKTN